jgi:hypothetical protein
MPAYAGAVSPDIDFDIDLQERQILRFEDAGSRHSGISAPVRGERLLS